MKETDFIDQNKAKWEQLEQEFTRDDVRPNQISHIYVETVDDLSFARTHYPNRLVRAYLNGVAEILSLKIQKSQRTYWKNFKNFWKQDLPLVMYQARWEFLTALLILAVSIGIGIFSSMHDPDFAIHILGEGYVKTTINNIEDGDPMGIYKDEDKAGMFFYITLNNIKVSVITFLFSLFLGFGTILVMVYNGVMIGVFQYFFIERGLFFESFLTIWQHGVVEISCIVLAGAAGLVLARGIMFPGSYSRLDAFRLAGRKSLIIVLGVMPLLVYSGAIEAFVTRYTDMHWAIRLTTILLSVGFVISYFVIYPRWVARKEDLTVTAKVQTQPIITSNFNFNSVQKNVQIFWESTRVLLASRRLIQLVASIITAAVGFAAWSLVFQTEEVDYTVFGGYSNSFWFLHTDLKLLPALCDFLLVFGAAMCAHWALFKRMGKAEPGTMSFSPSWTTASISSLILALTMTAVFINFFIGLLFLLVFPVVAMLGVSAFHSRNLNNGLWALATEMLRKGYGRSLGLLLLLGLALYIIGLLMTALVSMVIGEFLLNFVIQSDYHRVIRFLLPIGFGSLTVFGYICLLVTSFHLSFFSLLEVQTARSLNLRVDQLFPKTEENGLAKVTLLRKDRFAQ